MTPRPSTGPAEDATPQTTVYTSDNLSRPAEMHSVRMPAFPGAEFGGSETAGLMLGGPLLSLVPPVPVGAKARANQAAASGGDMLRRGQFDAAVEAFQRAVSLQPAVPSYHLGLATAAGAAGRGELVENHARRLMELAPLDAAPHEILAKWYHREGQAERALEHSAAAIERTPRSAPGHVDLLVLHAGLLHAAGRIADAADAVDRALATGSTDRWLATLNARLAPGRKQERRALEVLERAMQAPNLPPQPDGKPMLHFAASSLLDKLARFDEAFAQARLGNETLRSAAPPHDPAAHSQWVSRKIRYFTRERMESLPRATNDSRRPLFILGMPRSGTTLVEQMLACHPSVYPGGEMQALRLAAKESSDADWAAGESYPEYFDDLSLGRANGLASQYLAAIDALDKDAAHVTDKQPLNFLILNLVELLFPRGRVILCVRNALDTSVSCYLTNFEQYNPFKFDLAHLGAFYRDYLRLMEHWKKVLSVPILEVRYEDLVLDPRGQLERIHAFLGLPWEEKCMRYYENDRRVRTASVDQVRRPIYTGSVGRWKHYEKHLRPLIDALGTSA